MLFLNQILKKYLPFLISYGLLVFPFSSFSQVANLKFNHLTTSDGLSQNSVFAVLKDYKGFMWFGTGEGLNKYDGYKFSVYKHDPADTGTIADNSIYGLLEDADQNFWIVSAGGLDRFDRMKESFIHYNCGEKGVYFRDIFQDSKKRFWLSSNAGFCLFDAVNGKFKFYKNYDQNPDSLLQNYVYRITEDNYGDLWIGTRRGLKRFNPETEKFVHYRNDPANSKSLGAGYIKTVYKDRKGNIWLGTQGSGISLYNRADNTFINFRHDPLNKNSLIHNDILSFTEDSNGKLFIGTENGGISVFDNSKNRFVSHQHNENDRFSISGNSVYCLYKDDIGNIWAGTWSGGINFLPFFGNKFTLYRKIPGNSNSLAHNLVLSIGNGPDKNIWIGTDGGGLSCFDPLTHNFTNYRNKKNDKNTIQNDYVLSTSEYSPGILALGFHRGGMDLFDIQKKLITHYPLENLNSTKRASPSINIVYKDRLQNQWVGTADNGGLYEFDKNTKGLTNFYPASKEGNGISDRSIYVMYETTAGQLWLGGDKGLDIYDRNIKKFIHYQHEPGNKNSLSSNTVHSIMEDHAGNLWLGTADGLNFFDIKTKKFTIFTEKDGLPNNTIWSTQEDHNRNLWISTNSGLSKFNPSARTFRNFTESDGLQNNAFKARASYQSPCGEMFFGGVNGFNTFFPDSIKDNDFVPPVYFTDFQVFNKQVGIGGKSPLKQSINEVKEITLSHNQSVFTIEFASLNFTHPEQNKYAYKLEGFDEDWNYVGNKRTATYTNLNPGTYNFKVRGSNNDGVWNDTGASVKITITPPFWLEWWFLSAVFLLIIGSGFGFYRFRVNILQKQKILLEQKVNQQTVELVQLNDGERKARLEAEQARTESEMARQETGHANKELQMKNKELEQFAYVASHDLQEPLRTTSGFVDLIRQQYHGKLDKKADKYLDFISDASDRMNVLIKDLLDFSRIGANVKLKSIDCNIVMDNLLADIKAAIEESKACIVFTELPVINGYPTEIKLLFQNLVLNSIKFRKKNTIPQINITVQKLRGFWEFAIRDNGIGIEQKYGERIFEIFQRLHTRQEYPGSGIGLSHCKKIVELHHGKIRVESVPGEGSTFYFTIPEDNPIDKPAKLHSIINEYNPVVQELTV